MKAIKERLDELMKVCKLMEKNNVKPVDAYLMASAEHRGILFALAEVKKELILMRKEEIAKSANTHLSNLGKAGYLIAINKLQHKIEQAEEKA